MAAKSCSKRSDSYDCTQKCGQLIMPTNYDMLGTICTTYKKYKHQVIVIRIKKEITQLWFPDESELKSFEITSESMTDLVEIGEENSERYNMFLLRKSNGNAGIVAIKPASTTLLTLKRWMTEKSVIEIKNNCLLPLRKSPAVSRVKPNLDKCNYVYNTCQTRVCHNHHQKHDRNHWVSACPNAKFRKDQVVQRMKRKMEDQRSSEPSLQKVKLSIQESTPYGDTVVSDDIKLVKSGNDPSSISKKVRTEKCPEDVVCSPLEEHSKHKNADFTARNLHSFRRYSETQDDIDGKENASVQRKGLRQRKTSCLGKVKWKERAPFTDHTKLKKPLNKLTARVLPSDAKFFDNDERKKKCSLDQTLRDVTNFPTGEVSLQTDLEAYPAKRSKSKSGNSRNRGARGGASEDSQADEASSDSANQNPQMVTDRSEESLRRPPRDLIVTSSQSVFGSITASMLPIPSIGTVAEEQSMIARLRGETQSSTNNSDQSGIPPRHPEYRTQSSRQQTFRNWPPNTGQDSSRMAVYGFFYTGQLDLIRCFQCGIGLKDWSHTDEPLFEHVRHSSQCPFLRELLGNDLLNAYMQNLGINRSGSGAPAPPSGNRMRNPDYESFESRLATYTNWPSTAQQRPQTLAEAGLFYTGFNDLVRCFHCDGGLQRWEDGDIPWVEHARWFPQCNYVKRIKGQGFINMVRRAAEDVRREEEDPPVFANKVRERLQGQQNLEDPRTLTSAFHQMTLGIEDFDPAARGALELGFSRVAVRQAIEEFNHRADRHGLAHTTEDLVNILTARIDAGEILPTDEPSRPTDPTEENRRLKGIIKCMMCHVNDTNMLFLPCTHHKLCENCAENLTHCPVCNKRIEEKVKTFMS